MSEEKGMEKEKVVVLPPVTVADEGFEREEVKGGKVVGLTLLVIASLAIILLLLNEYFNSAKENRYTRSVLVPESLTIRDVRARDAEITGAYKVLDGKNGVYQIPVSRAMELVAAEAFTNKGERIQTGKETGTVAPAAASTPGATPATSAPTTTQGAAATPAAPDSAKGTAAKPAASGKTKSSSQKKKPAPAQK